MNYSSKALIFAVLLCGDINQKKVAAVNMSKCKDCGSTNISLGQPRQEACQMKTICQQYAHPHNPCQKNVIWKVPVTCHEDTCLAVNDHFDCEESSNYHTFSVCPTNGRH
ncbi:hypothetical protein PGT21_020303 [Puccinia graminis f. sp. tritici]|uniref:Uncharacterized protein n=1 Tax=Puccinia graminis f. sp. tritici TaxID=56615 RepID=A0A5B0SC63_PUCGR|nr:hypothetical protein PGT21_020303 [Puccinia graminis f. sp. tritici]KAA1135105.1 hypothetical protein PGTUg99_012504 [Puccinia graminis f. sp. tritici]